MDLKKGLKELDVYFDQFPKSEKEKGLFAFASYPPKDKKYFVTQLYDELIPKWRSISNSTQTNIKNQDSQLLKEIQSLAKAPPIDLNDPDFNHSEPESMILKRKISRRKGKWWQIDKNLNVEKNEKPSKTENSKAPPTINNIDPNWLAARIVHLTGGVRAINNLNSIVFFEPQALDEKIGKYEIKEYGHLFISLESFDLEVVGVDFYSNALEERGHIPPNWRAYFRTENGIWQTFEVAQKWRDIGHAAFEQKNGKLWDIGSRIGHQLKVCNWRLREISESYNSQLIALVAQKSFETGKRYEDGFSWLTYLAIQSFLVDACILRDNLSEFLFEFVYKEKVDLEGYRISAMGAFKKKILKKIVGSDDLTVELKNATGKNGWITLLGNYRDMVVHSAPIAQAERKLYSICDTFSLKGGLNLPAIKCPIPENPLKILTSRSTGTLFDNFDEQLAVFISAAKGEIPVIDGLEYATQILGSLTSISRMISEKSPLAPKRMVFNKSNIKGKVTTKKI